MFSGNHPSAWGISGFLVSKSLMAFRETDNTSKIFQSCYTWALGILEWHWSILPEPYSATSESFILICTPWSSTIFEQCFTGGKYHLKIFIITLKMYFFFFKKATVYGVADNFLGNADSQMPLDVRAFIECMRGEIHKSELSIIIAHHCLDWSQHP